MTKSAILLRQWSKFPRIGLFDPATGDLRIAAHPTEDVQFEGVFDLLGGHVIGLYASDDSLMLFVDGSSRTLRPDERVLLRPATLALYEGECELALVDLEAEAVLIKYLPMPDANLPPWEDAFGESKQDFGRELEAITSDPDRRTRLIQMWNFVTTNE